MRIFALLVGINDYGPRVGKLRGAVNDVSHYRDFLRANFAADDLNLEILQDADATRSNIISAFRQFLGRAGKDDVVLFQYAGHGARWKSAAEFQPCFPDGFDEGLICHDSRRHADAWDLADKELAILLNEVARNGPQITVILDCCHSGSGTRSVDQIRQLQSRSSHTIDRSRPLDSYLDGYYARRWRSGQSLLPPASRHLLMAGCDRYGQAFESRDQRGIFSKTLLEAIDRTGMDISYAELFMRVRALVRRAAVGQSPQFEAYQGFNAYHRFLNRLAVTGSKRYSVHYIDWDSWYVNCGAINGLSTDPDSVLELQLFEDEQAQQPLGQARATAVGLNETQLGVTGFKPDKGRVYSAEVTSLPRPSLAVYLDGEASAVAALVKTARESAVVAAAFQWDQDSPRGLTYQVRATGEACEIRYVAHDGLIQRVVGSGRATFEYVIQVLNRIAGWEHALHLRNPSPTVDPSVVELCFSQINEDGSRTAHHAEDITFEIVRRNGTWSEVNGQILGRNRTDQRLHLMLVWFTEQFGVTVLYNEPHDPGEQTFVFQLNVEDDIYEQMGFCLEQDEGNRATHALKLFVSKEKIDGFLLAQPALSIGGTVNPGGPGATRGAKFKKKLAEISWFTRRMNIHLVRQLADVGTREASLADGQIRIRPHRGLTAGASLLPASQPARSGSPDPLALALEEHGFELLNFSAARGQEQGVLEFRNIENRETLASDPLEMELDVPLDADEHIVPVVFDGERLRLAGDTWQDDEGKTRIAVREMPAPPAGSRSVARSLRLYFFKAWCGIRYVNQLSHYEIRENGEWRRSTAGVGEKIHQAERILLLVHGLFGNSETLARQLGPAIASPAGEETPPFDLVLGYDYESISTPLEEVARDLRELLVMKGLDAMSEKQITIVAHSTGGLVGRWLIEREQGNRFVDQLIMCGTPNEGSPLGTAAQVADSLTRLVNVALNLLPDFALTSIRILQSCLAGRGLTTSLSQLAATSEWMRQLNTSGDPGVRYTVIAGDVGELAARGEEDSGVSLLVRAGASEKLGKLFGGGRHDMAVSVESMRAIPDSRSPAPDKIIWPCHHLNYFHGDQGSRMLSLLARKQRKQRKQKSNA